MKAGRRGGITAINKKTAGSNCAKKSGAVGEDPSSQKGETGGKKPWKEKKIFNKEKHRMTEWG